MSTQPTEAAVATPRDEFRALPAGFEIRQNEDTPPTLVGSLAVFDQWTEIRSEREGHFMERMAPGAFSKTVAENIDRMRVLFQHGRDPSVGEKPLGAIRNIEIDDTGVHYEVDLLDTAYNRDLIPGLKAGLYGSSFRFEVMREDLDERARRSAHNPKGLPERTVTELRMSEFGPVTFPAYPGAKSGIRSITDTILDVPRETRADITAIGVLTDMYQLGQWFIQGEDDPDDTTDVDAMNVILASLGRLIAVEAAEDEAGEPAEPGDANDMTEMNNAPPGGAAREGHPTKGRRVPLYITNRKETPTWRL